MIGKKHFRNWQGNEIFTVEYRGIVQTEGLALMSKNEAKLTECLIYGRVHREVFTFILCSDEYNYLESE